jgi:cystathionine gamma-synthase
MTHASMTPAARAAAGISDRLVRFSIGLEHPEDLIRDLFAALDSVVAPANANVAYLRKSGESHAC